MGWHFCHRPRHTSRKMNACGGRLPSLRRRNACQIVVGCRRGRIRLRGDSLEDERLPSSSCRRRRIDSERRRFSSVVVSIIIRVAPVETMRWGPTLVSSIVIIVVTFFGVPACRLHRRRRRRRIDSPRRRRRFGSLYRSSYRSSVVVTSFSSTFCNPFVAAIVLVVVVTIVAFLRVPSVIVIIRRRVSSSVVVVVNRLELVVFSAVVVVVASFDDEGDGGGLTPLRGAFLRRRPRVEHRVVLSNHRCFDLLLQALLHLLRRFQVQLWFRQVGAVEPFWNVEGWDHVQSERRFAIGFFQRESRAHRRWTRRPLRCDFFRVQFCSRFGNAKSTIRVLAPGNNRPSTFISNMFSHRLSETVNRTFQKSQSVSRVVLGDVLPCILPISVFESVPASDAGTFSQTECGHCGHPATFRTAFRLAKSTRRGAPPFPRHAGVNAGSRTNLVRIDKCPSPSAASRRGFVHLLLLLLDRFRRLKGCDLPERRPLSRSIFVLRRCRRLRL